MIGENKLTFCFEDFYPSNVPYCHILKDIIEESYKKDFSIKILTTKKENKEELRLMLEFFEKYNIEYVLFGQTRIKALNKLLFPLFVFFHLWLKGAGLIIITTTPPVLMGICVLVAKFLSLSRFKYIYHCQDIHPEALYLSNILTNQILMKILQFIDNKTVKNSESTIVLSEDMKKTLLNRSNFAHKNISIINNFIPSAYNKSSTNKDINDISIRKHHDDDDIIFVFAGNIGIFQNLEMLLEGFLKLPEKQKVFLYFVGDGKAKTKLINFKCNHNSRLKENVFFIKKMNSDEVIHYISRADYGVVSLADGLTDVAYPSKIATYLNIGLPIFMGGGLQSSICREIHDNNLGICSEENNSASILRGMELAIKNINSFSKEHTRIRNYYQKNYNKKDILSKLIEEF